MRKYFIIACIAEMCTKSFLKSFKRKVHYHLINFAIFGTKKRAKTSQLSKSISLIESESLIGLRLNSVSITQSNTTK